MSEPSEPTTEESKPPAANDEVVGDTKRRFSRLGFILALVSLLLLVAVAGIAFAGYRYSKRFEGRILPGATVAGADIGGLTEEQALEVVKAAVAPQLDRQIEIRHKKKTWKVTPRELGAKSDARRAVRQALDASDRTSFITKTRMRVLGSDLGFERDVAITYPKQGVRGFIQGLAAEFDREAEDASLDYSTGWVEFNEERTGRKVQKKKSRKALLTALQEGSGSARLHAVETEPERTLADYEQVLLVRIGENKLYLYQDGKITHEWLVATGLPQYPTPTGIFEVELKRYMPTWVNPSPDTWGANLPASIPPGPGNPLGLRALNWTAPAIRFHGTSNIASLGHQASHGCVRMSNPDVIQLYDLVDVGTTIVSVNVGSGSSVYQGAPTAVDVETTQAGGSG